MGESGHWGHWGHWDQTLGAPQMVHLMASVARFSGRRSAGLQYMCRGCVSGGWSCCRYRLPSDGDQERATRPLPLPRVTRCTCKGTHTHTHTRAHTYTHPHASYPPARLRVLHPDGPAGPASPASPASSPANKREAGIFVPLPLATRIRACRGGSDKPRHAPTTCHRTTPHRSQSSRGP